jgi:hypothetical protein
MVGRQIRECPAPDGSHVICGERVSSLRIGSTSVILAEASPFFFEFADWEVFLAKCLIEGNGYDLADMKNQTFTSQS